MGTPQFDFTIFGASGFTGYKVAEFFSKHETKHSFAIAGRNPNKLSDVATQLGLSASQIVVADSLDAPAVEKLVRNSRVVISTVGPYALYGENLISACATWGKGYVDITGETPFIKDMIDKYEKTAKRTGAILVPACGFDSVPSDLGTLMCVKQVQQLGETPTKIEAFYKVKGGFNGGTIASVLNLASTGKNREVMNPFILTPNQVPPKAERRRHYESNKPKYINELSGWSAPFFMAPVNAAVVRRSVALFRQAGYDYGADFEYHERLYPLGKNSRFRATLIALGSGLAFLAISSELGRKLVASLAPKPGSGPSAEEQDKGFFSTQFLISTASGKKFKAALHATGDPGNIVTVNALCESARLLNARFEELQAENKKGFLTPGFAFGEQLLARLENHNFDFSFSHN